MTYKIENINPQTAEKLPNFLRNNLFLTIVKCVWPRSIIVGNRSVWNHSANHSFNFTSEILYPAVRVPILCLIYSPIKILRAIYTFHRLHCQIKEGQRKGWVKKINPTSYLKWRKLFPLELSSQGNISKTNFKDISEGQCYVFIHISWNNNLCLICLIQYILEMMHYFMMWTLFNE